MPAGERTVYVYGVLRDSERGAVSVSGVESSDVRTVRHGGLAALVSDLDRDTLSAAKEVRAHWRVLEEASNEATVLPVRFGTVMESEGAVRDRLLEPNAERLTGLLQELAGRVQLSVKADYDEERLLRHVVEGTPEVAALSQRVKQLPEAASYYDRIRLGELVSAEIERQRGADHAFALERLEPLAVAAHSEVVSGAHGAVNLAFLVERRGVERFSAEVRALAGEWGERLHIRYVGPLPPYSFAEAELTSEAGWA